MKKLGLSVLGASFVLLGCAQITPEAQSVMVHTQISSLLNDCERLGNVTSNVGLIERLESRAREQQAKNNVRDEAFHKYGADTVAIVNVDYFATSVTVQAIAFRCNPTSSGSPV